MMLPLHIGVCLPFLSLLVASSADPDLEPLSEQFIDYINNVANTTWKAGETNRFATIDDVQRLLGTGNPPIRVQQKYKTKRYMNNGMQFPKEFDARTNWPNCKYISKIRDQSSCASHWAFGAVETISDRICIDTEGATQVELSALDLVSCCPACGHGCKGGQPIEAWNYWVHKGLVTGGSKESGDGCLPYPFPACEHLSFGKYPPCPEEQYPTPDCVKSCQTSYNKTYKEDKYFGKEAYFLGDVYTVMSELMTYGPAQAAFSVYADFPLYKSGVYQHVSGRYLGYHSARLIGWGEENGTPYWLLANSWNEDWGDKGYFKILRDKDECGIDAGNIGGIVRS